jgi:hypothetical protein
VRRTDRRGGLDPRRLAARRGSVRGPLTALAPRAGAHRLPVLGDRVRRDGARHRRDGAGRRAHHHRIVPGLEGGASSGHVPRAYDGAAPQPGRTGGGLDRTARSHPGWCALRPRTGARPQVRPGAVDHARRHPGRDAGGGHPHVRKWSAVTGGPPGPLRMELHLPAQRRQHHAAEEPHPARPRSRRGGVGRLRLQRGRGRRPGHPFPVRGLSLRRQEPDQPTCPERPRRQRRGSDRPRCGHLDPAAQAPGRHRACLLRLAAGWGHLLVAETLRGGGDGHHACGRLLERRGRSHLDGYGGGHLVEWTASLLPGSHAKLAPGTRRPQPGLRPPQVRRPRGRRPGRYGTGGPRRQPDPRHGRRWCRGGEYRGRPRCGAPRRDCQLRDCRGDPRPASHVVGGGGRRRPRPDPHRLGAPPAAGPGPPQVAGFHPATARCDGGLAGLGVILGVPIGIAVGRTLWTLFARAIYAIPQPTVPVASVLLVAVGTLVLANLVAAVPGRMAARTPTALLLRAE